MTRKNARENAFILLFELECRKDETAEEIYNYALSTGEFELDDFAKEVFFGVMERRKEIDELLEPNFVGWKKSRISPVSRALLSLSTYEMLAREDIPAKVSINEARELSKKYDDEKSYIFVNGVLNAVADSLGLREDK
jgi:N utilization substance protein B